MIALLFYLNDRKGQSHRMQTAKTIVVCNQKGGVGKTVTSMCLGVTLGRQGAKVLLCDFDAQGNLTKGLGFADRQKYQYSIKDALLNTVNEDVSSWHDYMLPTYECVDLLPANISLAGTDLQIASVMSRETIFKRFLSEPKGYYDYIIIDSNPALNLFTINALTAADSVIIPVQAEPYATDGLNDLLHTIQNAKRQLNPKLQIDGILMTLTDSRTNLSKHIVSEIRSIYGNNIRVFQTVIPRCVKAAEASLAGQSPIKYAPSSEVSRAYAELTKEVKQLGKSITEPQPGFAR